MQIAAFGLAMMVASAIGIVAVIIALRDLPRAAQIANDTAARILSSYLAVSLNNHIDDLRQLADSSLIWTALSDSQGRDVYIKPFLDDRNQAMPQGRIALLDYRGRFVAGKAILVEGEQLALDALVQRILGEGQAMSFMPATERPILVVGVPIFFAYTQDIIGVLVRSIDLPALVGYQSVADLDGRGVRLRLGERLWTLWGEEAEKAEVYEPSIHQIHHPQLPALYDLWLEVYSTHKPGCRGCWSAAPA